jgi:signal transduction histidine kinase/CheY-like chemotaxis protein/HAMP domain-containing protein
MKMTNLKVGSQLRIGLGIILSFVVFLGAVSWISTDQMWQETQGLYNHPLTVRRALGDLKANILTMDGKMKDLVLAGNEQEIQATLQSLDTNEANAYKQFDIIYTSYLGPRSDIDDAYNVFVQWKAIREETIRLLRSGNAAEASNRIKIGGVNSSQVEKTLAQIKDISDFALHRGDQFLQDAQAHRDSLSLQLWIIMGSILVLSIGISYILVKNITTPLMDLTTATEQYQQGNLNTRSRYESANEFGVLAASFNTLAGKVQMDIQLKEKVANIADAMLKEEEIHSFCQELLKAILEYTQSQVGAVYLLNEAKTGFEHFESIGLGAAGAHSHFSAVNHEGEFGAALATRQIQHVTNIPEDTLFTFSTVAGDFKPRGIITIPVLSGKEVVAVVSLASVQSYDQAAVRLVNDIWGMLIARLNGVLAYRRIQIFSDKLESQNRELASQTRELVVQADELSEQNIELELQKKQLDEANRLKSTFLSNMSHELRTPLNSVIALSSVLHRRLHNTIPDEEYSYLEVIERNGKQLLALINDILDLSRIEAGREEINPTRFSFKPLVDELAEMIHPQILGKDIVLQNLISPDLPQITSDLTKCRHILQNLIGNAVKFTDVGKVEINAVQVDGNIRISVTDTGIGIAPEKIPFVFDEFRQADESTTRKYGGTGLGLAIARKYATLLHGSITVESTLGKGSTFTITLPLTLKLLTGSSLPGANLEYFAQTMPAEMPAEPLTHTKRILLVEDSEPAVIQVSDILVGKGYLVDVAHNGREALEKINEAVPDALILDLMMPEVDGFEVLRMIRSAEKTAQIPVLILTAKQVTREELNFLQGNHVYQLIQKGSINKNDLLAAVARMVFPPREIPTQDPNKPARPQPSAKPVILLVEDNPDNRKTVKALLDNTCQVIEANDGHAGLKQAITRKPDLILLDISLPGMDGFQVLQAIRNDETIRHTPIVALTARAMKGDREVILAHGFDAYLSKPVDAESLKNTISDILHEN